MMPITNKIVITQLDKFNERQYVPLGAGNRNTHPAIACASVQWIEVTIEITRPPFTSLDSVDSHRPGSGIMLSQDSPVGNFCVQIEKASRAPSQHGPYFSDKGFVLHYAVQFL
jgi:hypothetical protein